LPRDPVASRGVLRLGYRHKLASLRTGPKTVCGHPWFLTTSTAFRRMRCGLVASHCQSEVHRVSGLRVLILACGPTNRRPLRCRSEPDTRDLPRDAPTPRRTSVCDSRCASLRPVLPPRGCSSQTRRPRSSGYENLLHEALLRHSRGAGGFGCPPHARLHPSWACFPFEVPSHSLSRQVSPPCARPTPKSLP
jgi:hypothetical protein